MQIKPLGFFSNEGRVFFLYTQKDKPNEIITDVSLDGVKFSSLRVGGRIKDAIGKDVDLTGINRFSVGKTRGKYLLYFRSEEEKLKGFHTAYSYDLVDWTLLGDTNTPSDSAVFLQDASFAGKTCVYYERDGVRFALVDDFLNWEDKGPVLPEKKDFYGEYKNRVLASYQTDYGIILVYVIKKHRTQGSVFDLCVSVFDREDPQKFRFVFSEPLWQSLEAKSVGDLYPVGIALIDKTLISYWVSVNGGIYAVSHKLGKRKFGKIKVDNLKLEKHDVNPVLSPKEDSVWESRATFNPAAVYEEGKVHLLYRAIGEQDVSVLGHAASKDGINFDERSASPVYIPREPFESSSPYKSEIPYSPYASGGGTSGGIEDPRLTKIKDKYYMTYVAYNGSSHPRVALTSIKVKDFIVGNWDWKKPVLISPPGVVDKNAVVFPDKVRGKYVILHRIYPDILLDYVDDLDSFDGNTFLKGEYRIKPRKDAWDSKKIGAGPPPIRTKDGWLLIYQSVGYQDTRKYKIGAMLMDLANPHKVLARSKTPVLEPDENYENEGFKFGVVYPCGAIVKDGILHTYYGGADMFTCVASAPLDEFVYKLKTHEEVRLNPHPIRKIYA